MLCLFGSCSLETLIVLKIFEMMPFRKKIWSWRLQINLLLFYHQEIFGVWNEDNLWDCACGKEKKSFGHWNESQTPYYIFTIFWLFFGHWNESQIPYYIFIIFWLFQSRQIIRVTWNRNYRDILIYLQFEKEPTLTPST